MKLYEVIKASGLGAVESLWSADRTAPSGFQTDIFCSRVQTDGCSNGMKDDELWGD